MEQTGLVHYNQARQALQKAVAFDEVRAIRDKAERLRIYSKQVGESLDAQNQWAEIKLRAERRAGEMLRESAENGDRKTDGRPKNPDTMSGFSPPTLKEIGVTEKQSSRWQSIAAIPEEKFEQTIREAKERPGAELTTQAVLRVAKEQKQEERRVQAVNIGRSAPASTDRYSLRCGDFSTEMDKLKAGIIDVIITDPPYPREYLPLYETLAEKAARSLKPNGLCVVMCGHSYLPEIYAMMSRHLTYHWTAAYLTPGGQAVQLFPRKVNTFWKPLLIYSKGKYDGKWFGDVTKSSVNDNDKEHHDWGQSISGMLDVVSRFSEESMTVLDPFCGAGTTGVACLRLNRHFIGIDSDEKSLAIARGRLGNAGS